MILGSSSTTRMRFFSLFILLSSWLAGAGSGADSGGFTPAMCFSGHDFSLGAALKTNVTSAPPGGAFRISMAAPCRSMIFLTTESPRPVPTPVGLVVKKGSKILGNMASGMPLPVSCTSAIDDRLAWLEVGEGGSG